MKNKKAKARDSQIDWAYELSERPKRRKAAEGVDERWEFDPGQLKWDCRVTVGLLLDVLRDFYKSLEDSGDRVSTEALPGRPKVDCMCAENYPNVVVEFWPVRYGKRLPADVNYNSIFDIVLLHRHHPRIELVLPVADPPRGRPRKDWLAKEASELKKKGISWAQAGIKFGTTREAIRKLVKSREARSPKIPSS